LPTVSGSSGKLVIQQAKNEPVFADYPGAVFADENLSYPEAMGQFVAASESEVKLTDREIDIKNSKQDQHCVEKRALRQDEEALRAQRRQQRQCRQQEDAAFKTLKAQRRAQQQERQAQIQANQRPPWGSKKAADEQWKAIRQQRQEQMQRRQQEDEHWRMKREQLRLRASQIQSIVAWIAILVVVDNCTRQSLGLPLFVTGAKVTAQMVVEALQQLLPDDLQFLISDRGPQFTADLMKQLASEENFIHVVIARHRPQSNGIAERFVRTLKEWLVDKSWQSGEQLGVLLSQFQAEYNDRPHQGLPIPGLSPNEFAKRL
jgi:transposase InsO family protein